LSGTKLRALAESAGCRLGKDGYFRKVGDDGAELYSLGNAEPMPFHPETLKMLATRGVTVLFDVPRAPGGAGAFRAYIDFARHLAQALDGVLLDDERKAIGQAAIDQIGAQLTQIHQAMAARGIPAGSPAALRLFS
jgi:FtsZ-interacting cell division protein ZipA